MELNMIVAAGRDGSIGRRGDLIWHISQDLKRFKALTMGHPLIMGRKTWESLPKRPLPGRLNIVVTRQEGYEAPGAVVASNPAEALQIAEEKEPGNVPFLMGGAQIYDAMMPMATRLYLTEIDAECPDADARLPWPLSPDEWHPVETDEWTETPGGTKYRFVVYEYCHHQ